MRYYAYVELTDMHVKFGRSQLIMHPLAYTACALDSKVLLAGILLWVAFGRQAFFE